MNELNVALLAAKTRRCDLPRRFVPGHRFELFGWGIAHMAVGGCAIMAVRIFLVDDHEVVRRGVREMLRAEEDFEVVGEAGSVEEALSRVPATSPDVALLDLRLPDGNGVELCRELRSQCPSLACLILTSFDDDEAMFEAIVAGASGYLLKQVKANTLVDAVRQAGEGRSLLDPAVTARFIDRLSDGQFGDARLLALSGQERRVLDLLMHGKTNREIGSRMLLSEKTVRNYVSNILSKMGMRRRTEAAVFAAREAERQSRRL
jgi:two-component system response regulator DevR